MYLTWLALEQPICCLLCLLVRSCAISMMRTHVAKKHQLIYYGRLAAGMLAFPRSWFLGGYLSIFYVLPVRCSDIHRPKFIFLKNSPSQNSIYDLKILWVDSKKWTKPDIYFAWYLELSLAAFIAHWIASGSHRSSNFDKFVLSVANSS